MQKAGPRHQLGFPWEYAAEGRAPHMQGQTHRRYSPEGYRHSKVVQGWGTFEIWPSLTGEA